MSYDVAVWEGARPISAAAADAIFQSLSSRHLEKPEGTEPSPAIARFVAAITAVYPDDLRGRTGLTLVPAAGRSTASRPRGRRQGSEEMVWALMPIIAGARGPMVFLNIRPSRATEVASVVERIALEHGLVCFGPQRSLRLWW